MPDRAKRSSEGDRAAIVGRFDRAADIFEVFCPKGTIRLPGTRDGKVLVEIDLASFERLMEEMKNPSPSVPEVDAPPTTRPYPNLRAMLAHGKFYSFDAAQAEIQVVIDFLDGKHL